MEKGTGNIIGFKWLAAAIVLVSLVEASLAAFGIIPPILSYSPANLFFAFLRLAIVVYAGLGCAPSGLARASLAGGALFLASSLAICISVFALPGIATRPILGIFVQEGTLPALFATIVVENTLVGAALAAAVAWLSQKKLFRKILPSKKN